MIKMREKYYCNICEKIHFTDSNIGLQHTHERKLKQYKDMSKNEKPNKEKLFMMDQKELMNIGLCKLDNILLKNRSEGITITLTLIRTSEKVDGCYSYIVRITSEYGFAQTMFEMKVKTIQGVVKKLKKSLNIGYSLTIKKS